MKKVISLDVGDKWIGVAISDPFLLIASPLVTIKRESNKKSYELIYEIIKEHNIEKVVVGLPLNMNGSEGERAKLTRVYAEKLGRKYNVEIIYVDERLSTVSAENFLIEGNVRRENRKKYIDKIAAAHILQVYLDNNRRNDGKTSIF